MANVPLPVVFLTTILVGGLIGLINGLLVSYVRIPAIVVTLGTASILKGGLILVTGGRWIYGLPQGFDLSHQTWFGIPVPIFALLSFRHRILTLAAIHISRAKNLCGRRKC